MARNQLQRARRILTPTDALRFLVAFYEADLDAASPDELRSIERRVEAFMNRETPGRGVKLTPYDPVLLKEMQSRARGILIHLAKGRPLAIADDLLLSFWLIRDGAKVRVQVLGHPLHQFLYQCVRVLQTTDTAKLKACPAPNCPRLFIKVTKKRFCSTRCQSRVYMKKYRAGEVGGE